MTTERKCPDCGCCCDYSSPCCNLKGGNTDHSGGCKKITSGNLYIISTIGTPALLEQLAEESAELAQAALKFARKLRDENPAPKSEEECLQDLLEELADIKLCMEVFEEKNYYPDEIEQIMQQKRKRWESRISASKEVNPWISVKDRLPAKHERVLIYDSVCHNIYMAWRDDDLDVWFSEEYLPAFVNVTYWMPLPVPPEVTT